MRTTTDNLENLIAPEMVTTITDFVVLSMVGGYALFSFLLMRQIKLMNRSLATPMASLYTFIGRLHFAVSLILLLAALINLS